MKTVLYQIRRNNMTDTYNAFDNFVEKMKEEHDKLGAKMSKHMLENADLSEAWERFAKSVNHAIAGQNPKQIMLRMVQVADNAMYVYEMLDREDKKTGARKIAEAREQRRKQTMGFEPRQGDSID
jgi:hypothetical protein